MPNFKRLIKMKMKYKVILVVLSFMLIFGPSKAQLKIGQEYQGGIIAVLNNDGKSGLITTKSSDFLWMTWNNANSKCKNLGNGWRLTTANEWIEIFKNKNILTIVDSVIYWCDAMENEIFPNLFCFRFGKIIESGYHKYDGEYSFRAVRSFGEVEKPALKVGQEHQGGVIAVLNSDGQSGLIIQKNDMPEIMNWGKATLLCGRLDVGWRLPTIEELREINKNNHILKLSSWYWSASEISKSKAWFFLFSTGESKYDVKRLKGNVRVVRSF
jgi:hypothetical protein